MTQQFKAEDRVYVSDINSPHYRWQGKVVGLLETAEAHDSPHRHYSFVVSVPAKLEGVRLTFRENQLTHEK